jgi:hypothetical protein
MEANLLPTAVRNVHFEDILLDALLREVGETKISSLQESEGFVSTTLSKWVEVSASAVATDVFGRLSRKVFLCQTSTNVTKDSKLGKLLKIADKSLNIKNPLITQSYNGNVSSLHIVVLDFDEDDESSLRVVSNIVLFACALHGTRPENVSLIKDGSYGKGKITMSSSLIKTVDALTSSAFHPHGLFVGDTYNFQSGFKSTAVGILTAMRLLNAKSEFIRRKNFPRESGKVPISFNVLQETFNTLTGLRSDQSMPFSISMIKAILASCIKQHNKGYPGGWIHATRTQNSVKSDFALTNLLGWVEKVPSEHKLLEVLFNTVDLPDDSNDIKKPTVINITKDKRNFTHREFRTAVALSLPRVVRSNPEQALKDLSLDPFSVKSLAICNTFCLDKRDRLVDQLNEAYAFRISLKNPKSKTKEIHYKNSRDRLLALSANIPLRLLNGKVVETFSALPKELQKTFRDKFRYPLKKRDREAASDEEPDADMTDVAQVATTDNPPPLKRQKKITRGQASAAARESGRLAQLKKKNYKE